MPSLPITVDTRSAVDGFERTRRNLADLQRNAPGRVARQVVPYMRTAAPVRSGKLAREIHTEGGDVVSTVRSDKGFAYTRISRFGNATQGRIFAKPGHALNTPYGYRRSVASFHPARDWATLGYQRSKPAIRAAFAKEVKDATA